MFYTDLANKDYAPDLLQLLSSEAEDSRFLSTIDTLASKHGNTVYKETLRLLVGKHFGADLSNKYWQEAIEHCRQIYRPEYATRCFRPALLDYLHNVVKEINDPRIIEADYLHNITRSSVTDGLTGLYNQTYFKNILENTVVNQRRSNDQNFAIVLLDLDNFKKYNDRCGHLLGDEALRICASILIGALRDGDMAARYGGEEFALFIPNTSRNEAYTVAERIRREIEKFPFPKQELLDSRNLTISGGIAIYPDNGETAEAIIQAADQELYNAKRMRNTINCIFSDRRRNLRRPVRNLIEYASFEGELYRPALSIDISEEGMGFGCETALHEGMILSVRLSRPYWPYNLHVSAKVRQVRHQNELVFVGLEFDRSIDSLEDLLRAHDRVIPGI